MPGRKTTKTKKAAGRSASDKGTLESAPATETTVPIYQLKVTLKDFKPPIWRRIQVRSDTDLGKLHAILQMTMGWTNSHLHHFLLGKRPNLRFIGFGRQDEWDMNEENEDEIVIREALPANKAKMTYEYDFGDSWEHEVVLEKILRAEAGGFYPRCIAGENACPPEDVGGVWGYAEFLRAINDPENEEHNSYLVWIGGEFDPEEFDLDAVNKLLRVRKNYKMFGRGL